MNLAERRNRPRRPRKPVHERFWPKVDKDGPVASVRPELGQCWIWVAGLDKHGYGQFGIDYQMRRAHRVSYELVVGAIPDGLDIDHLCRNPRCVNPSHLEPVTRQVNIQRGDNPRLTKARRAEQTHCKRGHEFSVSNTRLYNGHRHCRACAAMHMRNHRLVGKGGVCVDD